MHVVGFTIEINYDVMLTRKYKKIELSLYDGVRTGVRTGFACRHRPVSHNVSQLS